MSTIRHIEAAERIVIRHQYRDDKRAADMAIRAARRAKDDRIWSLLAGEF